MDWESVNKMEVMRVKQQNKQLEIHLETLTSAKPTTNEHDKYKHLVTYTDDNTYTRVP